MMMTVQQSERRASPPPIGPLSPKAEQRIPLDPLEAITPIAPGAWLDSVIQGDHLFVVFQPIVNLLTGDVIGYEVLGRLSPDAPFASIYGRRGPAGLFELAHEHGRLLALDRRFREIAIATIAARHADSVCSFFLNVDPRIIDDPDFNVGFTRERLERHGLAPQRIVFELTEAGAVLTTERLEGLVRHYVDQGFRIALDDVGAGYASLTALLRLRPHFLKLDKELVQGLHKDAFRQSLIQALCDFGRRSEVRLIAEGIETDDSLSALLEAGVGIGQGYLLGRPAPCATPPDVSTRQTMRRVANRVERVRYQPTRALTIGALSTPHPSIAPNLPSAEVDHKLRQQPDCAGFPVVDARQRVVGLVMRDRFLGETSGPYGFALRSKRPVSELMDRQPLRVPASASLEHVCRLATARDKSRLYDPVLIEDDGRYLGVVAVHALLTAATEREVEHARYASPLTGLPGNVVIEHEMRRALDAAQEGTSAHFVYVDIDHFKAYNDVYGFVAGDEVIRLVARVLRQSFGRGIGDFFLGHIGGDDFVVIVTERGDPVIGERCSEAAAGFDRAIKEHYSVEDLARGGIETADRRGHTTFFPVAALSIAWIAAEDLSLFEVDEVARLAADLKHRAKARADAGSCWLRAPVIKGLLP